MNMGIIMLKKLLFLVIPFILVSCESTNFTIDDVMMTPVLEEVFDEMQESISLDWTARRQKPAILVHYCYDERFGKQTVTVISHWIQQELVADFVNSRKYKIIDSENIERLRNEKKFQQAGFVDDKVMVDEGRELGGNYLITSKISKYNNFESKITNIATSELVYTSSKPIKKSK